MTLARSIFSFRKKKRYIRVMGLNRIYTVFAFVAALCIALASISSAQHMAPTDVESAELQAYVLAGGSVDDLCSTDHTAHHGEDCPFCRLLSDPDDLTPVPATWMLIPDSTVLRLADVTKDDQGRPLLLTARGPPSAA